MSCHLSPSSFIALLLVAKKQQLLVVVTVGKTSDMLLRDAQYKIEKSTHQPVTALGRRGYSTGRSAAVFAGKPVMQLNTCFKALFCHLQFDCVRLSISVLTKERLGCELSLKTNLSINTGVVGFTVSIGKYIGSGYVYYKAKVTACLDTLMEAAHKKLWV